MSGTVCPESYKTKPANGIQGTLPPEETISELGRTLRPALLEGGSEAASALAWLCEPGSLSDESVLALISNLLDSSASYSLSCSLLGALLLPRLAAMDRAPSTALLSVISVIGGLSSSVFFLVYCYRC